MLGSAGPLDACFVVGDQVVAVELAESVTKKRLSIVSRSAARCNVLTHSRRTPRGPAPERASRRRPLVRRAHLAVGAAVRARIILCTSTSTTTTT